MNKKSKAKIEKTVVSPEQVTGKLKPYHFAGTAGRGSIVVEAENYSDAIDKYKEIVSKTK